VSDQREGGGQGREGTALCADLMLARPGLGTAG
jgi:hypothetical protein